MSDTLLLVNQVIHDMEHDFDYRLLWTETSDDRPSYWLRLTGNAMGLSRDCVWISSGKSMTCSARHTLSSTIPVVSPLIR